MSIDIDELSTPAGDTFKFGLIGDTVKGVVAFIGEWRTKTNNFGKEETSMKVILDTEDGPKAIYPTRGGTMAQAIGDAVRASGATKFEKGAQLAVKFSETKDTGKGNPLKLYVAQYKPAEATKAVAVDDLL